MLLLSPERVSEYVCELVGERAKAANVFLYFTLTELLLSFLLFLLARSTPSDFSSCTHSEEQC